MYSLDQSYNILKIHIDVITIHNIGTFLDSRRGKSCIDRDYRAVYFELRLRVFACQVKTNRQCNNGVELGRCNAALNVLNQLSPCIGLNQLCHVKCTKRLCRYGSAHNTNIDFHFTIHSHNKKKLQPQ